MNLKKNLVPIFLLLFSVCIFGYAQENPPEKQNSKKSLKDIAAKHQQIYSMSCIPMSIEMVLKYNNRVAPGYYNLQNNWKDKADGTFRNFDGKIIAGLKFKHQFDIQRGDNFPIDRLFRTIDTELAAGRKVIVSLPSGFNFWHIYVIDRKMEQDDYLAYSRFFNEDKLITKEYIKRWIRGCQGTDILTYTVIN